MIRKLNNENLNDINGGIIIRKVVRLPEGHKEVYYVYNDSNLTPDANGYDQDQARAVFYNLSEAQDEAKKHGQSQLLIDTATQHLRSGGQGVGHKLI